MSTGSSFCRKSIFVGIDNEDTQNHDQPIDTCESTQNDKCKGAWNIHDSQAVSKEKDEIRLQQDTQAPKRKTGLLGTLVGFFRKKSSYKDVTDVKTTKKREKDIKGKQ
ncbi:Hypothetical predicted protein [Mytilus galloprovincialis]|uniref:Uncharacterized protein n=1 Tax=Mytilus galloprovincialis TaxID=29158 RepID=A0A8B6EEP2_MYTGA|nr:Hypothetical predicted protein [Mytilus galloprovincialis]